MNAPNTQPVASSAPVLGEAALWIILRMPLLPVAAGLCAGILGDRYLPWPYWVHILAFLLAGGGLWQACRAREHRASIWAIAAILVAAAAVGGLRHQVAFWRVEPTHVALYVQQPGMLARLRGTILSEPVIRRPQANPYGLASLQRERTRFLLDCEEILTTAGWAPCTGLVRVSVQERAAHLRTGDRVETFAALRVVDPPSNRGEYDWQLHQRRRRVGPAERGRTDTAAARRFVGQPAGEAARLGPRGPARRHRPREPRGRPADRIRDRPARRGQPADRRGLSP